MSAKLKSQDLNKKPSSALFKVRMPPDWAGFHVTLSPSYNPGPENSSVEALACAWQGQTSNQASWDFCDVQKLQTLLHSCFCFPWEVLSNSPPMPSYLMEQNKLDRPSPHPSISWLTVLALRLTRNGCSTPRSKGKMCSSVFLSRLGVLPVHFCFLALCEPPVLCHTLGSWSMAQHKSISKTPFDE